MLDKLVKSQGMALVKSAMKQFLKPEDKGLIAWKDEKGDPQFKIYRVNPIEYIKELEKELLQLRKQTEL